MQSKIEPELFYLPFGKQTNKKFLIDLLSYASDITGHNGNESSLHGYNRAISLFICDNILASSIVNEKYILKRYKTISYGAAVGITTSFNHVLSENEEIIGEYDDGIEFPLENISFSYSNRVKIFKISIDPKQFLVDKIILSRTIVQGHGPTSWSYQCSIKYHTNNLSGAYINANCYNRIYINDKGGCYSLNYIYPNIAKEIVDSKIEVGEVRWWTYMDVTDKSVKSRYYIINYKDLRYPIPDDEYFFDLAKTTDIKLFSYK